MISKETWVKGLKSGAQTTWVLSKVVFPITMIVTILNFTPVIHWVTILFTPLMKWVGLPGEAAIPLALGYILNLYAGIGAILSLDLTVKNVFILALMLSFAHNLLVETAVAKKIGVKAIVLISIRIGLSFLAGFLVYLLWHGGNEPAHYGMVAAVQEQPETWLGIGLFAIKKSILGIWQIALIVVPLMLGIQVLKDLHAIQAISIWLKPLTRILGLSTGETSVPLLAGLIFGLAYGAGVIIESAKEGNFSKRDLYLLSIFLVASHAVIEDTLIFIPLGINVLPLLFIRVAVAFVITMLTAKVWQKLITHTELVSKGEAK